MVTPQEEQPQLAKALGLTVPLYFKREDLHPYGSHKGRSIPYMLEQYAKGGHTKFAISSSGNAALAAGLFLRDYNIKFTESPLWLEIYVGENISTAKFAMLNEQFANNDRIKIIKTDKPKQAVHVLNKKGEAKALRQSNDDLALTGYKRLVDELKELENVSAVFVPTSSGTTAQALAEGGLPVYIVQPSSCHPISDLWEVKKIAEEPILADAVVDIVALRKDKVHQLAKGGFVVSNTEIENAIKLAKTHSGLEASPNAALSLAGLSHALGSGWQPTGAVVCLITGR